MSAGAMAAGLVIAIDFGTTATCVAFSTGTGVQTATHAMTGDRYPSAVFANDDGTFLVGTAAVHSAGSAPDRYEGTPKRQVTHREPVLVLGGRPVYLVGALTEVIRGATAPVREYGTPDTVILTHPAVWDDDQINLVAAAVCSAGMPAPRFLPEPVAAAYAAVPDRGRTAGAMYAIYDWGGGTFDVALLSWDGRKFTTTGAVRGVDPLGGSDIDAALAARVLSSTIIPDDLRSRLAARDPADIGARRIRHAFHNDIRAVKHLLSEREQGNVGIGSEWTVPVTRDDVEEIAAPFVERTLDEFAACLAESRVEAAALAGVYLTGDAARLPLVATMFWRRFGIRPVLAPGAKAAVARGAVIRALAEPVESVGPVAAARPDPRTAPPAAAANVVATTPAPAGTAVDGTWYRSGLSADPTRFSQAWMTLVGADWLIRLSVWTTDSGDDVFFNQSGYPAVGTDAAPWTLGGMSGQHWNGESIRVLTWAPAPHVVAGASCGINGQHLIGTDAKAKLAAGHGSWGPTWVATAPTYAVRAELHGSNAPDPRPIVHVDQLGGPEPFTMLRRTPSLHFLSGISADVQRWRSSWAELPISVRLPDGAAVHSEQISLPVKHDHLQLGYVTVSRVLDRSRTTWASAAGPELIDPADPITSVFSDWNEFHRGGWDGRSGRLKGVFHARTTFYVALRATHGRELRTATARFQYGRGVKRSAPEDVTIAIANEVSFGD